MDNLIIPYDEAVRFFTNVTKVGSCPMCGTDGWSISIDGENTRLCYLQPSGSLHHGKPGFDLVVDCANCGFLRVHRANTIKRWLDENPSAKGSE
jgi:hypothetical protein